MKVWCRGGEWVVGGWVSGGGGNGGVSCLRFLLLLVPTPWAPLSHAFCGSNAPVPDSGSGFSFKDIEAETRKLKRDAMFSLAKERVTNIFCVTFLRQRKEIVNFCEANVVGACDPEGAHCPCGPDQRAPQRRAPTARSHLAQGAWGPSLTSQLSLQAAAPRAAPRD